MKPIEVSEEFSQHVISLFNQGTTASDISKTSNQPKHRIYRILKRSGIKPGKNQKYGTTGQPKERKQEIIQYYLASHGITETARIFGLSYGAIRKILKKANVLRLEGGAFRPFSDSDMNTIVQMWDQGKNQTQISNIFHTSQSTIRRILMKFNREPQHRRPKGENHGSWKGGRGADAAGYIRRLVYIDNPYFSMANSDGYLLEHRLVMAEHLGRVLKSHETVHHIDGDIQNNNLENLQLRAGNHGKGIVLRCLDCGSINIQSETL
jgi:hypothetical protein